MKQILFSIILLVLCYTSLSTNTDTLSVFGSIHGNSDTNSCRLKIINIHKVKGAFIIDAKDLNDNHYYRILSLKGKIKGCSKIKVGYIYDIRIWPYFKPDVDFIINPDIKMIVKIKNRTIIIPSNEWSGNVYLTSDLKGLYYSLSLSEH